MSREAKCYCIAIVGGGPRATYALERLAAEAGRARAELPIHVHLYELSGEFGAGRIHSPNQSETNLLNRTCRQVSFAADETVVGAGLLRPRGQRPSLDEWCAQRFAQTTRAEFDVGPDGWPQRRVGGLALHEMFQRYLTELREAPHVEVRTHAEAVTGLTPDAQGQWAVQSEHGTHCVAHHVLLVTGHPTTERGAGDRYFPGVKNHPWARHVPIAYPFERGLDAQNSGVDRVVGVSGMGLTAIDHILNLTEGRGGRFKPVQGGLVYLPSGLEPRRLVAFSPSGMFPHARPENFKETGSQVLEHRGVFFTRTAVDRLRERARCGPRRGLSFEHDLMPVIQLEMAYVFYRTLFGHDAGLFLAERAMPRYERFLSEAEPSDAAAATRALLVPVEEGVNEIARRLGRALAEGALALEQADTPVSCDWAATLRHWLRIVFGEAVGLAAWQALEQRPDRTALAALLAESPHGLEPRPEGNRFDFERTYDPLQGIRFSSPQAYSRARLAHMRRDLRWAAHGNVCNPYKAATDGVWRDLRGVLNHAVDNHGLCVDSCAYFIQHYRRINNKLSNGPGAVVIQKLCALIACGKLDISAGPGASAHFDAAAGRFRVSGDTGAVLWLDTLLEGHVPNFHAERNGGALYQSLLRQGHARLWRGERQDGTSYVPGYLDLSPRFHPLRAETGAEIRQLTVLGPAATLCNFFQFSLLRPNRNHVIMREILGWLSEVWQDYDARQTSASA